jgi:hypothetical protein
MVNNFRLFDLPAILTCALKKSVYAAAMDKEVGK